MFRRRAYGRIRIAGSGEELRIDREAAQPERIWTVGHSNRSGEGFLALLGELDVKAIADVRRYPGSRKFPHFEREKLGELLERRGIRYEWFEDLGGRRHGGAGAGSPNVGLRSPGFRNYADYMRTEAFAEAISRLLSLAARTPTAAMCAEKLYWRCHRRLLSDYLSARGIRVVHILDPDRTREHKLTPGAEITAEGHVVYR